MIRRLIARYHAVGGMDFLVAVGSIGAGISMLNRLYEDRRRQLVRITKQLEARQHDLAYQKDLAEHPVPRRPLVDHDALREAMAKQCADDVVPDEG